MIMDKMHDVLNVKIALSLYDHEKSERTSDIIFTIVFICAD